MNHDLSYLRTEYARNKDIECYRIEEKEAEEKRKQEEAESKCKES
jgi:hypothetical protein